MNPDTFSLAVPELSHLLVSCLSMPEETSRLWSSATLAQGMRSVNGQPKMLLAKSEDDRDLLAEYEVPPVA